MELNLFDTWTTDVTLCDLLKEKYENFIGQFTVENQMIIDKIISNIDFYDNSRFNALVTTFLKKIKARISILNTKIYLAVSADNKPHNSSGSFVSIANSLFSHNEFRMTYDYFTANKIDGNIQVEYECTKCDEIVLVDDYCGSGSSICKALNFFKQIITSKIKIHIACLFIVKNALKKINETISALPDNFEVDFYTDICQLREGKFISQKRILDDDEKRKFEEINREVTFTPKIYVYGFYKTEDIISFQHFTPNNTLGFLWYCENQTLYFPLFSRNTIDLTDRIFLTPQQIKNVRQISSFSKKIFSNKDARILFLIVNKFTKNRISKILKIGIPIIEDVIKRGIVWDVIIKYDESYYPGSQFENYIDVTNYNLFKNKINLIKANLIKVKDS